MNTLSNYGVLMVLGAVLGQFAILIREEPGGLPALWDLLDAIYYVGIAAICGGLLIEGNYFGLALCAAAVAVVLWWNNGGSGQVRRTVKAIGAKARARIAAMKQALRDRARPRARAPLPQPS